MSMELPDKANQIPDALNRGYKRIATFYGDVIIDVIKEMGDTGHTRLVLETAMEKKLADLGFTWDDFYQKHYDNCDSSCNDRTHRTVYLKIHSALKELQRHNRIVRGQKGADVLYFLNQTSMETVLGSNSQLTSRPKKKSTKVGNVSMVGVTKKPTPAKTTPVNNSVVQMSQHGNFKVQPAQVSNHYETDSYKHIEIMINGLKVNPLTKGKPGVGKTRDLLYFAFKHGLDCFHITFTEDMATWNLLGRSILVATYQDVVAYAQSEGINNLAAAQRVFAETWTYGVLAQACKNAQAGNKTVMIMDEINFASPSVAAGVLNMVLNDHKLVIPDTGEIITWDKEMLIFAATMNPDLVGTVEMNEALESRFRNYEYGDPDYKKIVKAVMGQRPSDNMSKLYEGLLKSDLSRTIGLREILFWTEMEIKMAPLKRDSSNKFHPLLIKLIREQLAEADRDIADSILTGLK